MGVANIEMGAARTTTTRVSRYGRGRGELETVFLESSGKVHMALEAECFMRSGIVASVQVFRR